VGTFTSTFTAGNGTQSKTLAHVFQVLAGLSTSPTASVSDTTARVSFRTTAASSSVAIKYASNSSLTGAVTTSGVAVDGTSDFTGAIDLPGLAADTQYWYTPVVDEVDQYSAPYPSFKTFPAAGASASFSFAFGACTKHSDTIGEDSIFNAIPAGARFFLHLGDTVYADRDPPIAATLADYRTQHRTVLIGTDVTTQDFKALRARMPVFTTWDDHDLANDFSSGTGAAIYAPAKQAFQEY